MEAADLAPDRAGGPDVLSNEGEQMKPTKEAAAEKYADMFATPYDETAWFSLKKAYLKAIEVTPQRKEANK
jgi:hypothetical protein